MRGQPRFCFRTRRVLPDEVHDWGGVIQSVGMVKPALLADQSDAATELSIALLHQASVLLPWHYFICVSKHVEQGHASGGKRGEIVHWVFRVCPGIFV